MTWAAYAIPEFFSKGAVCQLRISWDLLYSTWKWHFGTRTDEIEPAPSTLRYAAVACTLEVRFSPTDEFRCVNTILLILKRKVDSYTWFYLWITRRFREILWPDDREIQILWALWAPERTLSFFSFGYHLSASQEPRRSTLEFPDLSRNDWRDQPTISSYCWLRCDL